MQLLFAMDSPWASEAVAKALPAALVQNPAVIAFDDMQGDWVPTSVINRVPWMIAARV